MNLDRPPRPSNKWRLLAMQTLLMIELGSMGACKKEITDNKKDKNQVTNMEKESKGFKMEELSLENLNDYLNGSKPVVLVISATWCEPCKAFYKELEGVSTKTDEEVLFVKVTTDQNKDADEIMEKIGLEAKSLPTVLMQKGSKKVQFGGFRSSEIVLMERKRLGVTINSPTPTMTEAILSNPDHLEEYKGEIEPGLINKEGIETWLNEGKYHLILSTLPYFAHETWAEEIIQKIVDQDPEMVSEHSFQEIEPEWVKEMNKRAEKNWQAELSQQLSNVSLATMKQEVTQAKRDDKLSTQAKKLLGLFVNAAEEYQKTPTKEGACDIRMIFNLLMDEMNVDFMQKYTEFGKYISIVDDGAVTIEPSAKDKCLEKWRGKINKL